VLAGAVSDEERRFFSDAIKEIIGARVWSGIHFRTADVQGAVLGRKVAHYEVNHYFAPTS
jgi:hypothetical protein